MLALALAGGFNVVATFALGQSTANGAASASPRSRRSRRPPPVREQLWLRPRSSTQFAASAFLISRSGPHDRSGLARS
jgi:hypothetical protein